MFFKLPLAQQQTDVPFGKGAALRWLDGRICSAKIPDFISVTVGEWRSQPDKVLALCRQAFDDADLAVRSDAAIEDSQASSFAGQFHTLLSVTHTKLAQAIDDVAFSMPGHPLDSILIQRMVTSPRFVGVASTHRIADGAPWYCLEWSRHDTASVTAGRATGRQISVARDKVAEVSANFGREPNGLALNLIREIENAIGNIPLEIEFVIADGPSGEPVTYLLQMRPLAAASRWAMSENYTKRKQLPSLAFLGKPDPLPQVSGNATLLSLMADWNPAELIGTHPRPLALSLFRYLIADGVWWQARTQLGYQPAPLRTVSLLKVLRGRPFVDIRRSANSLLPTGLPPSTKQQLVRHWIHMLSEEPALHDKVEFRVFRTVRDFSSSQYVDRCGLDNAAYSQWEGALGCLTQQLVGTGPGTVLWRWCGVTAELQRDDFNSWHWSKLLHRCKLGTFAFSVIARLAFAAEAQLRTAVQRGALTPERALALRATARNMQAMNLPSAAEFDHLRPGTFDINQPAWSSKLVWRDSHEPKRICESHFELKAEEARSIAGLLKESNLQLSPEHWMNFVQQSASAREWSKFVFSRHLCAALEDISQKVGAVGLEREHASWLTRNQLTHGLHLAAERRMAYWLNCFERAKRIHAQESHLITSPVLRSPLDCDMADSLGALPNFIGDKPVHGVLVALDDPTPRFAPELKDAVVLVSKADPGFDWLFGCSIAGLITEWGGANSHMAIRCAEFGLSAAIGCGSSVHARALAANRATIDPGAQSLWFA